MDLDIDFSQGVRLEKLRASNSRHMMVTPLSLHSCAVHGWDTIGLAHAH